VWAGVESVLDRMAPADLRLLAVKAVHKGAEPGPDHTPVTRAGGRTMLGDMPLRRMPLASASTMSLLGRLAAVPARLGAGPATSAPDPSSSPLSRPPSLAPLLPLSQGAPPPSSAERGSTMPYTHTTFGCLMDPSRSASLIRSMMAARLVPENSPFFWGGGGGGLGGGGLDRDRNITHE
jgi:hypothetical protein